MVENEATGAGPTRGARVFSNSQDSLRGLLQPNEQLLGTMLTMFRRRGWMKRCVIAATPTRLLILPIRIDGTTKGSPIEIRRDDVQGWKANTIESDVGTRLGTSLQITTVNGKFQINPPLDVGIPDGFDQRCVVDFLSRSDN